VGQCGLAHLAEHLLFQGTHTRDALTIARLMDTSGGKVGGFTTRDYACYHATVLDDDRTYALELLGDVLLNATVPAESVDREKRTLLREIAGALDAPSEHVHALLKATAWPNHSLGRPVAGAAADLERLNRGDVVDFLARWYVPTGVVAAAAGNVDHADFVAQVGDGFWRMAGHPAPPLEPPPVFHPGFAYVPAASSQVYFALGFPAPSFTDPQRFPMHVLTNILGVGVSSRLFRRVREELGLAFDLSADYHAYRDAGMLVVEGSTAPDALPAVLGAVLTEVWGLATLDRPVAEEELWKARRQLLGQFLLESENSYTVMARLATQEFYFGRTFTAEESLQALAGVDAAALERCAAEWWAPSLPKLAAAVVGPADPAVAELLAGFRAAAS
ncbi:MAG: M16 family metallopeptidase, partial [Planctomycetia bacterium]